MRGGGICTVSIDVLRQYHGGEIEYGAEDDVSPPGLVSGGEMTELPYLAARGATPPQVSQGGVMIEDNLNQNPGGIIQNSGEIVIRPVVKVQYPKPAEVIIEINTRRGKGKKGRRTGGGRPEGEGRTRTNERTDEMDVEDGEGGEEKTQKWTKKKERGRRK